MAGREISEEEGNYSVMPSSINVALRLQEAACVLVSTRTLSHHQVWIWLKPCGHRHTTVSDDINEPHAAGTFGLLSLYTLNRAVRLLPLLTGA